MGEESVSKSQTVKIHDWTTDATFHSAAADGNMEAVMLCLKRTVDLEAPNDKGRTVLHEAASNGHAEIAKTLLEHGAFVDATTQEGGVTPLRLAAERRHAEVVGLLLERGALTSRWNSKGSLPIHFGAIGGSVEVLRLLIGYGSRVVSSNNEGWTPIHFAAQCGHLEAVRWLLSQGADVQASSRSGMKPIHSAALGGHVKLLRLLRDKGADVNALQEDEYTPTRFAAAGNHTAAIQQLLRLGADISMPCRQGFTPLHAASFYGHRQTIELLIEKGVDIIQPGFLRNSPFDLARSNGHTDVVRLLHSKYTDALIRNGDIKPPSNLVCTSPNSPFPRKLTCSLSLSSNFGGMYCLRDAAKNKLYGLQLVQGPRGRSFYALRAGPSRKDPILGATCRVMRDPQNYDTHDLIWLPPKPECIETSDNSFTVRILTADFVPHSTSTVYRFAMECGGGEDASAQQMEEFEWKRRWIGGGTDDATVDKKYFREFQLRQCSSAVGLTADSGNLSEARDMNEKVIAILTLGKNRWTGSLKLKLLHFLTALDDRAMVTVMLTAWQVLVRQALEKGSKTNMGTALGYGK